MNLPTNFEILPAFSLALSDALGADASRVVAREQESSFSLKTPPKILAIRFNLSAALSLTESGIRPSDVEFYQTFRADYSALSQKNLKCIESPIGPYQLVLYLPTQFKEENLANFALALSLLTPDGRIVCAQSNQLGARSTEQRLADLTGGINSFSKNKCRGFWASKSSQLNDSLLKEWMSLLSMQPSADREFSAQPGVFSYRAVDAGSKLLTTLLPTELSGLGADLGSGTGYLSKHVLLNCPNVTLVHLFEAEKLALDASSINLKQIDPKKYNLHWADVPSDVPSSPLVEQLDWVVMNPPFHTGGKQSISLGEVFINRASQLLKKGGQLFMVANENLPYSQALAQHFEKFKVLQKLNGFIVYYAIK